MSTKKSGIILLAFFMLTALGCRDVELKGSRAYVERKNESSLVYTGLLIDATGTPTVWGGLSNSYYWFLELEGGSKIVIKKSVFWLAPVGKEIFIYKYKDRHNSPHEYYVELEMKK